MKFKDGDYIKPNHRYVVTQWERTVPDLYVGGKIMVTSYNSGDYYLQGICKQTNILVKWSAVKSLIDSNFDRHSPLTFKYKKRA